jgi:hypothetical protein
VAAECIRNFDAVNLMLGYWRLPIVSPQGITAATEDDK